MASHDSVMPPRGELPSPLDPTAPLDLAAPVEIGPFTLARLVGTGGMGAVFLAIDRRSDEERAIKLLRPELAFDLELRSRFLREARTASALEHPNIAKVFEVGELEISATQIRALGLDSPPVEPARGRPKVGSEDLLELPYLAMEWIEGHDLGELIGREMSLERLIELGQQILGALAAAHRRGVVHRDLKPANVRITRDGDVRLLDFGLAKILSGTVEFETTSQLTLDGMILGTVPYLAPEQLQDLDVGPRADLFAFGVLFYELIAGEPPFSRTNMVDYARSLMVGSTPSLITSIPTTPPWLDTLVAELVAFDPDDRPASAEAVIRRLRQGDDSSNPKPSLSPRGSGPEVAERRAAWQRATGLLVGTLLALALVAWTVSLLTP